jgi:transposase
LCSEASLRGGRAALPLGPPSGELARADPRESSSGLRRQLGAISKRGDPYVRMLLIHGARSVLLHAKKKADGEHDRLRAWALDRARARGHNKAAVALANKLARIVWAAWRREHVFGAQTLEGAA